MSKPKLPADPKDYYVHSDISLEELAKLYSGTKGCSFDNLRRRSGREKWQELRHTNATVTTQKATEKTQEKIAEKTATIVSDLVLKNPLLGKERILQELSHIAFFSMADIADVDEGGTITYKPFSEVPEGAKRALKKLREKRTIISAGEGAGDNMVISSNIEAEPNDKIKALAMLFEFMGYKQPEPPKPEELETPEEIAGYLDIWNWTEEEKVIYMATGQKPSPKTETP